MSKKEENCFFCTAIKDNQDRKNLVLYRGKECFCILNKYPYNSGHLMVAPKMHKDDLSKLSDSEMLELLTLTRDVKDILTKKLKPEGFNLGINFGKVAGAGVEGHIHLHLVPRWKGDTNFMPVIAETKVIPQSLEDLYLELKDYF
ncbi:MAG: HIT domain-containing protein [Candidatus Scalindua sediminis]|nr:HIT domain-containing protein [Candidatus Scalindua sediminis]